MPRHLHPSPLGHKGWRAQAGKLHFGVILGWSVVGSSCVWFVVYNLAGKPRPLPCTCPRVMHHLQG